MSTVSENDKYNSPESTSSVKTSNTGLVMSSVKSSTANDTGTTGLPFMSTRVSDCIDK